MTDREKVLKGLEYCMISDDERKCPDECPYYERCWDDYSPIEYELKKDALQLLKKQQEQKFFVDSDGKITPLPMQKHGRWIDCDCGEWKCSACNDSWYLEVGDPEHNEMNYCPMCGAKMDEKGVECRCE